MIFLNMKTTYLIQIRLRIKIFIGQNKFSFILFKFALKILSVFHIWFKKNSQPLFLNCVLLCLWKTQTTVLPSSRESYIIMVFVDVCMNTLSNMLQTANISLAMHIFEYYICKACFSAVLKSGSITLYIIKNDLHP